MAHHKRVGIASMIHAREENVGVRYQHLPICPQNTLTEPGGLAGCLSPSQTSMSLIDCTGTPRRLLRAGQCSLQDYERIITLQQFALNLV